MRSCGACFFGRFERLAEEGECRLAPPAVFMVRDVEGEATFVSVLPTVGRQNFCRSFSHHNERPPAAGWSVRYPDDETSDAAGDVQ